jgi:hypothetical protein
VRTVVVRSYGRKRLTRCLDSVNWLDVSLACFHYTFFEGRMHSYQLLVPRYLLILFTKTIFIYFITRRIVDQIKIPVDFIVSRPVASCLGHGRYVMRDDEAKVAAHTSKG